MAPCAAVAGPSQPRAKTTRGGRRRVASGRGLRVSPPGAISTGLGGSAADNASDSTPENEMSLPYLAGAPARLTHYTPSDFLHTAAAHARTLTRASHRVCYHKRLPLLFLLQSSASSVYIGALVQFCASKVFPCHQTHPLLLPPGRCLLTVQHTPTHVPQRSWRGR